jgi:EamA domain-containing membrane protein RarD
MSEATTRAIASSVSRTVAGDGFAQILVHVLLAVLGGLPIGSLVGGLAFSFYVMVHDGAGLVEIPAAVGLGLMTALFAMLIGIVPAFVYGAPLYALLAWQRLANPFSVSILGAAPGVVLWFFSRADMSWVVLGFGVCVAFATHAIVRRRLARLRASAAQHAP